MPVDNKMGLNMANEQGATNNTNIVSQDVQNYSGINMGNATGAGNFSAKNVIEDFMKTEYEEGFRNEFNTMDALINKLPKDTITGKVKYKSFALGITDNIRAMGSGTFDKYELGFNDFYDGKGRETVDAQFDTTKLMATFSITDEAILKGTGDGSLIDVLKDRLSAMEVGTKHTYNRFIYGGHDGIIGKLASGSAIANFSIDDVWAGNTKDILRESHGAYHNFFFGEDSAKPLACTFSFVNSHSLIEGMGCMVQIEQASANGVATDNTTYVPVKRLIGRIWQKDNSTIHNEKVIMLVDKTLSFTNNAWSPDNTKALGSVLQASAGAADAKAVKITIYSRQINDAAATINNEYHGLEDIVIRSNSTKAEEAVIFGVDRRVYSSLRCTLADLEDRVYLNEEILRDMSDHLALTSPEGTSISLVCSNHRIISAVEKSLYQFKNYNLTNVAQGMQLGGNFELRFDNFVLYKDKYARDNNVYMLDQQKIGELVRRDFTWITSGEVNGVLQRRPGTELYEGIMNKYADMYIDAWRCHAAIKRCKVPGTGLGEYLSYATNGSPYGPATPVTVDGVVKTKEQA